MQVELASLNAVIQRIRDVRDRQETESKLRDRMSVRVEHIRSVAESWFEERNVAGLANELLTLLAAGRPTPVLSVCGRGTAEIRFTQYLAYFLSPESPHGLGDDVLRAFLEGVESAALDHPDKGGLPFRDSDLISQSDLTKCVVHAETGIGKAEIGERHAASRDCTLDILILHPDWYVAVEQKVKASEGTHGSEKSGQLSDYDKALDRLPRLGDRPGYRVYLKPHANVRLTSARWIALEHGDVVERLVDLLKDPRPAVATANLQRLLADLISGVLELDDSWSTLQIAAEGLRDRPSFATRWRFMELLGEFPYHLPILRGANAND